MNTNIIVDHEPVADGGWLVRTLLKIEGESRTDEDRVPLNLSLVLDRSGSMRGEPIAHALASVRELIAHLSNQDRFALITYASHADEVIRSGAATAEARRGWLTDLSLITVGGGTNMASGIDLATATVIADRFMENHQCNYIPIPPLNPVIAKGQKKRQGRQY